MDIFTVYVIRYWRLDDYVPELEEFGSDRERAESTYNRTPVTPDTPQIELCRYSVSKKFGCVVDTEILRFKE